MSCFFVDDCASECLGALPWSLGGEHTSYGKSAQLGKNLKPAGGPGVGGPALDGAPFVRVTIATDKPVLDGEALRDEYNPLSVTLTSADAMPGVVAASAAQRRHVETSECVVSRNTYRILQIPRKLRRYS